MELFECILIFSGAMIAGAVFVTILLCHHKVTHKKQVSFPMAVSAACIATPLSIFIGAMFVEAPEIFDASRWVLDWPHVRFWLALWSWGFMVSLTSAFVVVAFYKKRSQRDETPVA
jgi:hypothetical protein